MFFPVKTELQSESLHELQFISYCRPDKDQHAGFVLTLRETLFYVFLMFHSAAVTQHPSSTLKLKYDVHMWMTSLLFYETCV